MDENKKCACGCEEEHDHCDCGCEEEVYEFYDENNNVHKFHHLGTIEHKGKFYAGFIPADEEAEMELVLFEVGEEDENGNTALKGIEDQALLDEVHEEFCKALDEAEDGCDCEDEDCDCHHHHD